MMKRREIIVRLYFKKAFTLVELLVVISIIAMLLAILMPALGRARAGAMQTVCLAHMRQVGMALTMYSYENRDKAVAGRFHNGGDWLSVNSFYSNLTPYLDPAKKPNDKVWAMSNEDAKKYNQIWEKLICPAERRAPRSTAFQGITIRTLGLNIGVGYAPPNTGYDDGFGLQDWGTGRTRKLTNIRNVSGMMAFCDTRDTEYIYIAARLHCAAQGYDPEWYYPVRHPSGFSVTFVDGHSSVVSKDIILQEDFTQGDYEKIWQISN